MGAGLFGAAENPDAGRLAQQVRPQAMRLIATGDEPPARPAKATEGEAVEESVQAADNAAVRPPVAEPAPALATPAVAPHASPNASPRDEPATLCLAWEGLGQAEVDKLASLLTARFAEFRQERRRTGGDSQGWWVYIPPLADKAAADRRAEELRQAGVSDFFVVPEGNNRLAISLGIFSSEKGAQERLAEMKGKGIRAVRLAPRPAKDSSVTLRASGPESQRGALLAAVARQLPRNEAQACR